MKRMQHPEMSQHVRRDLQDRESTTARAMCGGKDPLTWAQARSILDRTPRKSRVNTAFHCQICHAWHIGSPLRKRKPWRHL